MSSGMSVFVAFFVLLLLLADSTPPAASTVPLIGTSPRKQSLSYRKYRQLSYLKVRFVTVIG